MPWYYADNGQQTGPLTDEQFQSLIQSGTIRADTLVWRDGMANWQPCNTITMPAGNPPVVTTTPGTVPGTVICAECRQPFPVEQTARFGDAFVCPNCKPVFVQKLREGAPVPAVTAAGPLRYAGFWVRFGAKFIDQIILNAVTIPFTLYFIFKVQRDMMPPTPNWSAFIADEVAASAIGMAVALAYAWVFVGRWGATPGKMVFGLRVVTPEGSKVTYARAFGRYWGEVLSGLTCSIGYIIAAFDIQKRALHDHVCATRVVYK